MERTLPVLFQKPAAVSLFLREGTGPLASRRQKKNHSRWSDFKTDSPKLSKNITQACFMPPAKLTKSKLTCFKRKKKRKSTRQFPGLILVKVDLANYLDLGPTAFVLQPQVVIYESLVRGAKVFETLPFLFFSLRSNESRHPFPFPSLSLLFSSIQQTLPSSSLPLKKQQEAFSFLLAVRKGRRNLPPCPILQSGAISNRTGVYRI